MVGTVALSQLKHDAIIDLYDLDLTKVVPNQWFYFTNYEYLGFTLSFQNRAYVPMPIQCEGMAMNGTGQAETATLKLSNIVVGFMALIRDYQDLADCRLIRRRVFFRNLDGQQFANPAAVLDESHWYLDRVQYNKLEIQWELRRLRDLGNYKLPARVVASDLCGFRYRRWVGTSFDYSNTSECGYQGNRYFDLNDLPCGPERDVCSHTLQACELRRNSTRFGGFPGAGNINYSDES